jgi:hypothetical protein
LDFHAVTVQPGRGNKEPYLSPEYFQMFKVLVEEAKKRNLRVWIIDDAGYPSGFAGGLISEKKPELRVQALTIAQRLQVKGGETLNQTVGPDTVAVTAINAAGQGAQVPIANGAIGWTAPPDGDLDCDRRRARLSHIAHGQRDQPDAQEGHDAIGGKLYGSGGDHGLDPVHARRLLQGHAGGVWPDDHRIPRR